MACLRVLIDSSPVSVKTVITLNYVQYRLEFRIWNLRSANRYTKLYGVYSAKSW